MMAFLLALLPAIVTVRAVPTIALPINSQVPPVARVSEPYSFIFSSSTVTSSAPNLTYSIANAPAWLQLNGSDRRFFGTPKSQDVGAVAVNLTATDLSGSVQLTTTFVVSADPAPRISSPVDDQLPGLGNISGPRSLVLYPSSPFGFQFSSNTFVSNGKDLLYYAVSMDNTPLPSWIHFDAERLGFSGTTPQLASLTASPQIFGIQLIASDVAGFSGAVALFELIVGSHELTFTKIQQVLNATKGVAMNFTSLRAQLVLDGRAIGSTELLSASAHTPSWLAFDDKTLTLTGTPPQEAVSQDIQIIAKDVYGDLANATVHLSIQSLIFSGLIGDINATIGTVFNYTLPQALLTQPKVSLEADLGTMAPWLRFDAVQMTFYGTVPRDARPEDITVTLVANSAQFHDSRDIRIHVVEPLNLNIDSTSTDFEGKGSATSASSSQSTAIGALSSHGASRKKVLAVAIAVPIVLSLVSALFLITYMLRHRKRWERRPIHPTKDIISGPMPLDAVPVQAEAVNHEDELGQEEAAITEQVLEEPLPPIAETVDNPPIRPPSRTSELSWSAACYKSLKLPRPQSREIPTSNNGLAAFKSMRDYSRVPQRKSIPIMYTVDYPQRNASTLAEPPEAYHNKKDSRRFSRRSVGLPMGRRGGGMGHGVSIDKNRSYDIGDSMSRNLGSLRSSGFETVASGETQSTDTPDLSRFPTVLLAAATMTTQQQPQTKRDSIRVVTPLDMAQSSELGLDSDSAQSPDPCSHSSSANAAISSSGSMPVLSQPKRDRQGPQRQISPDRRSLHAKRNSYIQKRSRIHSHFFAAGGSSRVSSQMQPFDPPLVMQSSPQHPINKDPLGFLRTGTQRSIECSSKYSTDETYPTDTGRQLTKISDTGLESRTKSSMAESHRYDSASSLPQSCKSQEAPSILLVERGDNGRTFWYQKVSRAGRGSSEDMASQVLEDKSTIEGLRVSRAMSTRLTQSKRDSTLQPIRSPIASVSNGTFKLIDSKGKRPVSVGSPEAGKGKFGSQRGEVGAFL